MSADNSFSIGVFPEGQQESKTIDVEYLKDKGFETTDDIIFTKEMEPGRIIHFNLPDAEILIKKGYDDPIHIAKPVDKAYLEGFYKTLTGINL